MKRVVVASALIVVGAVIGAGVCQLLHQREKSPESSGSPPPGTRTEFASGDRARLRRAVVAPAPGSIMVDPESGFLFVSDEVLVRLKPGKTGEDFEHEIVTVDEVSALGFTATIVGECSEASLLQVRTIDHVVDRKTLDRLRDLSTVQSVAKNGINVAAGELAAVKMWGLHRIGAPLAWDRTMGEGTLVAVVDTGCDAHPDFAARLVGTQQILPVESGGASVSGHGTSVTGTIAGAALGNEWVPGVAPRARVLQMEAMWSFPTPDGRPRLCITDAQLCQAVKGAVEAGALVVNLSIQRDYEEGLLKRLRSDDTDERRKAMDQARAECQEALTTYGPTLKAAAEHGVICVVAAGNIGQPADWWWVAASDSTIAVAASDENDKGVVDSGYESSASEDPGRSVDLCAPGDWTWCCREGGGYGRFGGTSAAAPHVAGVVALLKSLAPAATFDTIRRVLWDTGVPVTGGHDVGRRVDAGAAVEALVRERDGNEPVARRRWREGQLPKEHPFASWSGTTQDADLVTKTLALSAADGMWGRVVVRFLIDQYLRVPVTKGRAAFDEFGRDMGAADWKPGPPPDLSGRDRFQYAWDRRAQVSHPEKNESLEVFVLRTVGELKPTK